MSDKKLLVNHFASGATPPVTENKEKPFPSKEERHQQFSECFREIQSIFNKGYSADNGAALINYVQKQRNLLSEVMINNFVEKPNPGMALAITTILSQIEKSIRDDRKEALQSQQVKTSRETFDLFSKTLVAVSNGHLTLPDFGSQSLLLDPMVPLMGEEEAKIKPGELIVGKHQVDIKSIEQKLIEIDEARTGEEIEP